MFGKPGVMSVVLPIGAAPVVGVRPAGGAERPSVAEVTSQIGPQQVRACGLGVPVWLAVGP